MNLVHPYSKRTRLHAGRFSFAVRGMEYAVETAQIRVVAAFTAHCRVQEKPVKTAVNAVISISFKKNQRAFRPAFYIANVYAISLV